MAKKIAIGISTHPSAITQAEMIKQARKVLEPEEVNSGRVPTWLSKRTTAYWKTQKMRRPSHFSLRETIADIAKANGIRFSGLDFLDHYGSITGGPYKCCKEAKECFVAEPYGFDLETARLLDAVESALDVVWHISANSWHLPGRTIRIIIHEPGTDCIGHQCRMQARNEETSKQERSV
jgi:hypothetical protein